MFNKIKPYDYLLNPGYIFFSKEPALICAVLGNAVGVALYDYKNRFGGMNHFKYPKPKNKSNMTAIYGMPATYQLIRILLDNGAEKKNIVAQVFGGALNDEENHENNFDNDNILIPVRILNTQKIKIIKNDTGGARGRKVVFNTFTGEAFIHYANRIRQSDWA